MTDEILRLYRNMKKLIITIKNNFNQYHFILLWTLLNIIQTGRTELTSDEGYYWFYSTNLQWGYYDHPPLLAFLIKIGTHFFSGEIGVRVLNVLLISSGLIFLFKIYSWNKRERNFIYLILLSIPLFNYLTIIAFPDSPLIAFSVIALYAYKKLLEEDNLWSSLFFGATLALMLYSKYHAVIFIFFILLSNLNLLRNKYFYISILLSGLLFIPHLLWQIHNDFPSFQYHLYGRASGFEFANLFQYVTQQILIIGLGIIFIPFIYKPENQFEKTLKYIIIGTFSFFLISTLRGFVHLHWTSIVLFPIIILSAKYYSNREGNRLFSCLVLPFLVLIVLVRLFLAFPLLPFNTLHVDYYHGRKEWAGDISKIAGERPVVFEYGNGALREAPLYSFYSKKPGIAFFPGGKKKSQYQLWNYEDSIQAKSIIFIKKSQFEGATEFRTRMGNLIYYKEINNFISFNNIKILCQGEEINYKPDSVIIPLQIINHRQNPLPFNSNHKIYISVTNKENKEFTFEQPFSCNLPVAAMDTLKLNFLFSSKALNAGKYEFIVGIIDGITDPPVNSRRYKLMIPGPENREH